MRKEFDLLSSQQQKLSQRLILSPQMKQSLHLLQLPVLELSSAINEELALNPLLEVDGEDSIPEIDELLAELAPTIRQSEITRESQDSLKEIIEGHYSAPLSLLDFLKDQANEHLVHQKERLVAEQIIGNLDEKGFFSLEINELALFADAPHEMCENVLKKIQNFDPPGIGAKDLQESLLIQLRRLHKETRLAYQIVEHHWDCLMHNRIPLIAKKCKCSKENIYAAIQEDLASLSCSPAKQFTPDPSNLQTIIPDVMIYFDEEQYKIIINDDRIPHIRLNPRYLQMLEDKTLSEEVRHYIHEKLISGKSFIRNLFERNQTLYRIAQEITRYQNDFFSNPQANLKPMTMRLLAETLGLHESTVARASSNKYLSTPRGLFSIRSFFTQGYTTDEGEEISSTNIKELVKKIISEENAYAPYSDEAIASLIKKQGIICARRTVTKYRKELNLGNTCQRRIH